MGKQRRSSTPEFKQDAVDLCRWSGKVNARWRESWVFPRPTLNRRMHQIAGALLVCSSCIST
jgi:hypothetical protein